MSARLTVVFRDPPQSRTELFDDTCAAGEAVAAIATQLGAEIAPSLVTQGRGGHLLRDRATDAPIRISEVVATYDIEEI